MTDMSFLADAVEPSKVKLGEGERGRHANDWATEGRVEANPDAVVYPTTTDDVSRVLAACDERGVPVTPYAAATGLEGNAVPVRGGVSLDMTEMDSVIDVRPDDFQVDVEPGVYGSAVNEAVDSEGMFFPPLPSSGSISTIGGMVANDAGGMGTVRYGKVGDWIDELEVVLADGSVVEFGSKAKKTSSGYRMRDLIVGSEGTLGVVTRATLRLKGIPEQRRGGRATFPSLDDAASAVFDAVRSEVDVAKIELVDATAASMANDYLGTDLPDAPMVFVEFHANHGVEREVEFARSVFEAHNVESFEVGEGDEADELWELRRELGVAIRSANPSLEPVHAGDIAVPLSEYPATVRYIKEVSEEYGLPIPCFGHAGDGNIHYLVLVEKENDEAMTEGVDVYEEIVEYALDVGGTCTAEHGIGLGKRKFMEREHGEDGVAAMRAVKDALDPNGTLNPGKVFPDDGEDLLR
ncbi:MAG: FAD-binding oxidoreductase [Halobacteriales archaeon]